MTTAVGGALLEGRLNEVPGYPLVFTHCCMWLEKICDSRVEQISIPHPGTQPAHQRELHIDCGNEITDQRTKQRGLQACFVFGGYSLLQPNLLGRYSRTNLLQSIACIVCPK